MDKRTLPTQELTFEADCGCFKTTAKFEGYTSQEKMHEDMLEWARDMKKLANEISKNKKNDTTC